VKALKPEARIVGVESSGAPAMQRSVREGRVVTLDEIDCAIDGLKVKRVGEHTFELVRRNVEEIVTLPDREIFDAVVWTLHHAKVLVEGAAAAPVAALLHGLVDAPPGTKVACVLSGGNVNLEQLRGLAWN
jgi:threonine dehydratase